MITHDTRYAQGEIMDTVFLLGQIASLVGLAYGGWLCFTYAGRYDVESLQADEAASRKARVRAHVEPEHPYLDLAA